MATTFTRRLIEFLIARRNVLALLAIGLALLAIVPARELTFDQSIESMYAEDDPRLRDYIASKSQFGGDEFVCVAYTDPELFSAAGQERLKRLADQLGKLPGVVAGSVQSLPGVLSATRQRFMKRQAQKLREFARGLLLGEDEQTTAVVVRLADEVDESVKRADTIAEIRQIAADQPTPAYVVGEPVLVRDVFRYAQHDGQLMGWASSGLLIVVILMFLRGVRWVVLPFLIVQVTIVWTKAGLALSHLQMSMVSSMLTSLLTIIGVSTVVYMSLFYRKLRETLPPVDAVRQMLGVLGVDIFWVCATTAAGFAAGLSSHIYPVQSLGIMMIMGSALVLAAMALLLPAGILVGAKSSRPESPLAEKQLDRALSAVTNWSVEHPWKILCGGALVVLFSVAGLFRLRVETDFSKNFRASTPVVQALDFVETRLGGAGAWEVNFPAPETLTQDYLDRVEKLAANLREIRFGDEQPLTKVVALTDGVALVPRIPVLIPTLEKRLRTLEDMQPEFVPSLYNAREGRMRIMLRAREREPADNKDRLIARVTELAREEFPDAKATGLYVMLTFMIQSLLADQWVDLLWGVAGILTMMTLAYRSIWFGIISLISNLLPMVLVIGAMGWLGLTINIGTAMISSDAMGLTVHDSIFYLSAFLRARRSGKDFHEALRETQTEVRKPLIYSNVALMLGFLVLSVSHFIPLVYFGCLVSAAILGGLISNLVLLPPLLRLHAAFAERGQRMMQQFTGVGGLSARATR